MEPSDRVKCVIRRRYVPSPGVTTITDPKHHHPQQHAGNPLQPIPANQKSNFLMVCRRLTHKTLVGVPKECNFIQGRARALPVVEHVPEPEEEPDEPEIPLKLRKYSLYAASPEELKKRILDKALTNHMTRYFQRGKKKMKEERGVTAKPYARRKYKPQSKYVNKEAKLSRIQHVPIPRALIIDRLLQSK